MQRLATVLTENEDWLMNRILHYARAHGYASSAQALMETWKIPIASLTQAIIRQLETYGEVLPALEAHRRRSNDPVARFGMLEGRRHREHGIDMGTLLGLLKYYRQTYVDLVERLLDESPQKEAYLRFIYGCFDRIEIGVGVEWASKDRRQLQNEAAMLRPHLNGYSGETPEIGRKLQDILDCSPALITVFDETGRFLMVNKACHENFSLGQEEIVGKSFADVFPLETARTFYSRIAHLTTALEPFQVEDSFAVKGEDRVYSTFLFSLRNSEGKVYAFCSIGMDITRRKRAEEALSRANRQNALTLNAAGQGILGIGMNGRNAFVNPAAARMLGWDTLELVGRDAHTTCHHSTVDGKEYPRSECPMCKTLETGIPSQGDDQYFWRKDGSRFPISYTAMPIVEDGRVEGVVVTFSDISERKDIEAELMKAKKKAEIANEAKSQFLSNMSHELRTPLNGIMGMIQLLMNEKQDEENLEYLEMLKQSSTKLLELVRNLFDLSNIEFGRLERREIDFGLRKSLEPLAGACSVQAKLKKLDFHVSIDEALPERLHGDILHLKQVLTNLLKNAIHYTFAGEVNLHVEDAGTGDQGSRRIRFIITDSGIGIAPEKQQQIFDSFVLGEEYLTKKYSGSGLGLSIAARLVKLLGGELRLCSDVGVGSTFAFVIELHESKKDDREDAGLRKSEDMSPLRILYAEDEEANQHLVKTILGRAGHEVEIASDGVRALDALSSGQYDLVLMDIQMPGMDGLEATRRIREMSITIPIIALTSYASDEDRERFEAAGMDGLLHKPFEVSELMETLVFHGERRH